MLFRACVYLKTKSLQAVLRDAFQDLRSSVFSQTYEHDEKVSRCTSGWNRGSLTVEAALVFPLFLFAVTAFLYLFLLLQLRTEVGRALTDTAKELAQDAYFFETSQELPASVGTMVYGRYYLDEYLEGRMAAGLLKGGTGGISMLGSVWQSGTSELTLRASYQALLPPGLSWFHPIRVVQTKTVRGWTGFDGRFSAGSLAQEELVYVTAYGKVYHRKLDCRHLKLSIRQAYMGEIEGLRNNGGAKYYPCEYCGKKAGDLVYITEDGNRYHGTLNCQGLVRGIRTLRISETGGLPPCSVCGG